MENHRHGRFRGNVFQLEQTNSGNGLKVTPETTIPRFDGPHIDYDLAVLALIQADSVGKGFRTDTRGAVAS